MFNVVNEQINWAGRTLTLETGKVARQASGAVLVTYGETMVLATVVISNQPKADVDFLPLSVHYLERFYASGRIPGGFLKRESKPSDAETLKARLIDRPIRPLFPAHFYNEIQVICTVLSFDGENDPDVPALIAASAALIIAGAPILAPVAASRVGLIKNEFVINPTLSQLKQSQLDLVVSGTHEGVLMVESQAQQLTEAQMLEAIDLGHSAYNEVIDLINKFSAQAAKPKIATTENANTNVEIQIKNAVQQNAKQELIEAYNLTDKMERHGAIDLAYKNLDSQLSPEFKSHPKLVSSAFKKLQATILREAILNEQKRVDGRNLTTVRPIVSEVKFSPRAHGSALFTRGETQAVVVATLGTAHDEQLLDGITGESKEHFMLHYNFPSFSVGEIGRVGAPGRREIGHGRLAWKAIQPLLPTKEQFGYTIRVVSEITESNGSSSMATVCGTSLALMDAGVPLKEPVAGIAMGLIKEGSNFAILTDILGDEDHLGDMDFKVAGTANGITALQMDIKITSINSEIMRQALDQAKVGRLHILNEMNKTLGVYNTELSAHAPKMVRIKVKISKIRDIIGSGGKVIRGICEKSGAKVDIDDTGNVSVSAPSQEALDIAIAMINEIIIEPEVGKIYTGTVVKTAEFGAFVNFMPNRDGLVHISELAIGRVNQTEDVVKIGDVVQVKVLGVDDKGKVKLSIKATSSN